MYLHLYKAAARGRRKGFALRDLVAVVFCVSILFWLGCPLLNQSRISGRESGCLNNIRQVGLSAACFEAATTRFPLVSDAPTPLHANSPGTYNKDRSKSSGYSWLARLLPSIEEAVLYDELKVGSDDFERGPFDPTITRVGGIEHIATTQLYSFRCPAYSGGLNVQVGQGSEYDALKLPGGPPAIANYVATVGTHVHPDGTVNENGVIVSKCAVPENKCEGQGLQLRDITDGISTTIIACETVEPIYCAWIDGQASWVVTIDPDSAGRKTPDGAPNPKASLLGVGGSNPATSYSEIGLIGARGWPGRITRGWGPSSHHSGGVILHVFADAHACPVSPDVDLELYFQLISRNDHRPLPGNCSL